MSVGLEKSYIFDDPEQFVFNDQTVEISSGSAKLKMAESENTYSQDFSSSDDFVFDSSLVEFVAGLIRQKDQRQTAAIEGITYTSSVNSNWIAVAPTLTGSPVLTGGKLACLGGGNVSAKYSDAQYGALANTGAVRLRYTPNYSGSPAANTTIFEFAPTSGNASKLLLIHGSTGALRLTAYNSAGTAVHTAAALSVTPWAPVSGTEYEIELDWDSSTGAITAFINGVLYGSTPATTFTRGTTATEFYIGAGTTYPVANGSFNDVLIFSAVQHTATYTPGYSVSEYIYLASTATFPEMEHLDAGVFLIPTDFVHSDTNSPKYTVQVGRSGNYLYWNGSAWAVSNGTYSQATLGTDFDANISELPVEGEIYVQLKIHFQSSNAQQSSDATNLEILESTGYPLEAQKITPESRFQAGKLTAFFEDIEAPASTHVRYILEIESQKRYWDGEKFAKSNGTFSESSPRQDIEDNILLAVSSESYVKLIVLLKTDDEFYTPEISSASFTYDDSPTGSRGFYDYALDFIGAASLTDEEFESITVENPDWNEETYLALLQVLNDREMLSDTTDRLEFLFLASGADVSEDSNETAVSNIFIGGALED